MEKYSGSYGGTKENFVILNNPDTPSVKFKNSREYALLCVVQNILLRGCPATKPSEYIEKEVGIVSEPPLKLIGKVPAVWSKTIKGDENNADYPARLFFDDRLSRHMGGFRFIRELALPEAEIDEILERKTEFTDQCVDFYFPQIKTVVEIDGKQHLHGSQKKKDLMRDKELEKNGIAVIRIPAEDVRADSQVLKSKMEELKNRCEQSPDIKEYLLAQNVQENDIRLRIDAVLRLQILFLSCLKSEKIHLSDSQWKIKIDRSDIPDLESLAAVAHEDLKKWVVNIAQLLKIKVSFPELIIVSNDESCDIKIDFSMFHRYSDETVKSRETVYLRTDYFPDKNYYRVANADFLIYDFDIEKDEKDKTSALFLLRNLFGHKSFREGQAPIISNILAGNDTIGILPTGLGKSLCYQFAAMLQPGISMIVAPLVSLMQDQKRSMDSAGISRTAMISSLQGGAEKGKILRGLENGRYHMIWVSPERFQIPSFREAIGSINAYNNFAIATIDEVHCLSEWGHDFRVSYLALIPTLREYCPGVSILGLTATASQAVLNDLKAEFEITDNDVKALISMDRPELVFKRRSDQDFSQKTKQIEKIISELEDIFEVEDLLENKGNDTFSGLVFCPTVDGYHNGCNIIAKNLLKKEKFRSKVKTYSGKLTGEERSRIQDDFLNNQFPLLVCTKAFGMGIDKENIRYTIHASLPPSLEAFYQEAGRAGRSPDKEQLSYCYILYSSEADQEAVNEVFNNDFDQQRIRDASEDIHGDLSTILYFWNSSHQTEQEDVDYIYYSLQALEKNLNAYDYHSAQEKTRIEKAFYKLFQLGYVKNWSIKYLSEDRGIILIDFEHLDQETALNNFLDYVRKYDPEFSLDKREYAEYAQIYRSKADSPEKRLVQMIVRWTNQNIYFQRLQCVKTMMDLCEPDVTDEQFRERINAYFRYDAASIIFDHFVANPHDYMHLFDIFYINGEPAAIDGNEFISGKQAEMKMSSLARYLESYPRNTGLRFIDAMLHLYCGKTVRDTDLDTIDKMLEQALNETTEIQEFVFENILRVAENLDLEKKERLSEVLVNRFPEKGARIFLVLQDRYSLSVELDKRVNTISRIAEEELKWTI